MDPSTQSAVGQWEPVSGPKPAGQTNPDDAWEPITTPKPSAVAPPVIPPKTPVSEPQQSSSPSLSNNTSQTKLQPASPGFVSSAYHAIMDPTLSRLKYNGVQIFDPKYAADFYDPANADPTKQAQIPKWVPYVGGGTYRSLAAGQLEGWGNAVNAASSPFQLATVGAFKKAQMLSKAAKVAGANVPKLISAANRYMKVGGALSAPYAAHGAYTTATAPTWSGKAYGLVETLAGLAGALSGYTGIRPGVKPGLSPEGATAEGAQATPQPEAAPPVDVNAEMVKARQRADQIVKAGPEPLLTPEEIPAAKARLNELVQKATTNLADLTPEEYQEGKDLDRRLREVNFGETGLPSVTGSDLQYKQPDPQYPGNVRVSAEPEPQPEQPQVESQAEQQQPPPELQQPPPEPEPQQQPVQEPPATPDVLPSDTDINARWDENQTTPEDLDVLRRNAMMNATDEEVIQAAQHLNETRAIRAQHNTPPTASEVREARNIEMELNRRGLSEKITPEPYIHSEQQQQLPAQEKTPAQLLAEKLGTPSDEQIKAGGEATGEEPTHPDAVRPRKGEKYVVYDADGNRRVLTGEGANKYIPEDGETYGVETPRGFVTKTDNGGNVTGNIIGSAEKPAAVTPPAAPAKPQLPKGLAGAKPRFNMGGDSYEPVFESDLDKALYIIAGKTKSARHADYLKFVMDSLGVTEAEAVELGNHLKKNIKQILLNEQPGKVSIPSSGIGEPEPAAAPKVKKPPKTTKVPPKPTNQPPQQPPNAPPNQPAAGGKPPSGGGKPPTKPPTGGGPPEPPEPPKQIPGEPIEEEITPEDVPKNRPDKSGPLQSIWDLSRGLMSVDLPYITSAGFRQGNAYIGTAQWFRGWANSARAYGSAKTAELLRSIRAEDPLLQTKQEPVLGKTGQQVIDSTTGMPKTKTVPSYTERMGLRLSDLTKYSMRDDAIKGELAERIPWYGRHVAANNRAFSEFIDTVSFQTFKNAINSAVKLAKTPEENPMINEALGKQIAEAVNTSLKRGRLGFEVGSWEVSMEKNARLLGNVFFSPRNIASEVRMLNPSTYATAAPAARKVYVEAMARRVGAWVAISGAAKLAGAQVSLDPTNSDFGKIKIGNTRIDPPGGLSQFIVLAGRLAYQGSTSSTSGKFTPYGRGYKPETSKSQIESFIGNRFHPSLSYLGDLGSATRKEPVGFFDRTAQMAAPMFLGDLADVAKNNPELIPAVAILSSAGMGTQSYDRGSYRQNKFLPSTYDFMMGR